MKKRTYRTITGRHLDLAGLGQAERDFLSAVQAMYEAEPEWSTFASWWTSELNAAGLSERSVAYRICQDLEARLGIAQGKVAVPDYRDYLADLIEERYGSRYRFCKETGVDPGHLSRVLSSQSELSLQNLQRILETLRAVLVLRPEEELSPLMSPEEALAELAYIRRTSDRTTGSERRRLGTLSAGLMLHVDLMNHRNALTRAEIERHVSEKLPQARLTRPPSPPLGVPMASLDSLLVVLEAGASIAAIGAALWTLWEKLRERLKGRELDATPGILIRIGDGKRPIQIAITPKTKGPQVVVEQLTAQVELLEAAGEEEAAGSKEPAHEYEPG